MPRDSSRGTGSSWHKVHYIQRFTVVLFETVCPLFADKTLPKGGGVCFIADDQRGDWQRVVARIAQQHLQWDLGRCVEVGVATLDEALLAAHSHKVSDGIYWQGGDEA